MNKKVISIWTDGSSHNNGQYKGIGGYGAVLIYGELPEEEDKLHSEYGEGNATIEVYEGFDNTTNQQMEIKAVTEALKRIRNKSIPIMVFSDSAYVVNCMLEKWWHGWITNGWKSSTKKPVANREYWEELIEILQNDFLDITFVKKKSHIGIFYNELADKLAKRGMEEIKLKRQGVSN